MTELQRVDAPLSPFTEARAWIDKWEKEHPDLERVYLIADLPDGFVYSVTGGGLKSTDVAGMFFAAAQLAAE